MVTFKARIAKCNFQPAFDKKTENFKRGQIITKILNYLLTLTICYLWFS